MLETFRNFLKSKIGAAVALAVLVLIALAFASSDVAGNRSFGGIAGGDRVARVGNTSISTAELRQAANAALENARQEDPRMSMQAFLSMGGLDKVLDDMIARTAIAAFGRDHGIVAGDRLVDSEIAKIPAFRGPDGKFSDAAYRQLLQQRGISDKQVRDDLAQGLVARMVLLPGGFGAVVPADVARRYAQLLQETRVGAIGLLPSPAFRPAAAPSPAELQAYYTAHRTSYIRPERRTMRFALFGDSALGARAVPTEAEIAASYNAEKARYQAVELRKITQLVLPTQAAAAEVAGAVAKGAALDAAARAKGLATSSLGPLGKADLAEQTSPAIADAAFAATRGVVGGPVRGALGWTLVRVDSIENRPARTLDQARGEIVAALAEKKRKSALADLSARIEEGFDNGGNLAEAAKQVGVNLQTTPPITADGQIYGQAGAKMPAELTKVVQAAFAMERENQPQIAEVVPGKTYVMFDVTHITASAPAPLAEIRQDVETAWMLEKGALAAKAAAARVMAETSKGATLQAAMASLGRPLPPVQQVSMNRQQLTANGQQVPPPLMLLFSMAKGTVKLLPAPDNRGWFIVSLSRIDTRDIKPGDPLIAGAQRELGNLVSGEYAEQLRAAIRAEVGATRHPEAIRAVRDELGGKAN